MSNQYLLLAFYGFGNKIYLYGLKYTQYEHTKKCERNLSESFLFITSILYLWRNHNFYINSISNFMNTKRIPPFAPLRCIVTSINLLKSRAYES